MNYASQRDFVRELAQEVRAVAGSPVNTARRKRWTDVNALRKPDRAPVFCNPGDLWAELLPDDLLHCGDPHFREIETYLRRKLFKNAIGDDEITHPYYPVHAVFDVDPPNVYGVSRKPNGLAALNGKSDYDRLIIPTYTYNKQATDAAVDFAGEQIGDILPPRICNTPYEYATLTNAAATLRGFTQFLLDTYDNPRLLHRLMAHMRDAALSSMDQKLAAGNLTPIDGEMYISDELNPAPGEPATYKNCIGAGNAQELDLVSPAIWEEFLLVYQRPIFERFGLAAYGCCESLDTKIDGVLSIPNLRIVVCSAWSNLDRIIDKTGINYAIMWRQKATDVCFAADTAWIKNHLEDGCQRLQGGFYQIVLRELQTLDGHNDRLHVWAELAKEAAAK